MADVFNQINGNSGSGYFISVRPKYAFESCGGQPLVVSLLGGDFENFIFTKSVGLTFEFGTLGYKAGVYRDLIERHTPIGLPLIPSNDEACWMAAASCAGRNPFVAVLHGDEDAYFRLAEKYKESVAVFVCVSNRIYLKLIRLLPDVEGRATVIPCGIFTDGFESANRRKNGLIWVGRLCVHPKRANDILPIFRLVRKRYPFLHLTVLGDGDYYDRMVDEVEKEGMKDFVRLPGWVDSQSVGRSLEESRVFIQTSAFEGASVAMMEALAAGCIVVSTRVSGVEDLLVLPEAKGIVFLYNVGDIDDAARILENILSRDDVLRQSQAQELARTHFDIARNTSRIIEFVDERLNKRGATGVIEWRIRFRGRLLSLLIAGMRKLKLRSMRSLRWA